MATGNGPSSSPGWIHALGRHHRQVAITLVVLGLALVVVALVLGIWKRAEFSQYAPAIIGCGLLGTGALLAGLVYRTLEPSLATQDDTARLLVLILGGWVGFVLAMTAVWLGVLWWKYISGGMEMWQGPEGWRLWAVIGVMLVGLLILFASLLLARGQEQEDPALRRLLYGYVALLTGILLLMILLVLNVLAYFYMPEPADWTTSKLYTLNERSREILKSIEKPVKVYFLVASRRRADPFYPSYEEDVSNLLELVRGVTDKVQSEVVVPGVNIARYRELAERYPQIEPEGLLIVYGSDEKEGSHFLKKSDLYDPPPGRGKRQPFKGEDALVSAINHLSEGKAKAVIYFTQGHGELDIGVGSGDLAQKPEWRATELVRRLEKENYEIKGLDLRKLSPEKSGPRMVVDSKVPDDATAVVIAGPRTAFAPEEVEALRKYMNTPNARGKKGRLFVLLGVVAEEGRMVSLGLEPLLAEYNVELGTKRILQANPRLGFPARVIAIANPTLAERNPVAMRLADESFLMLNTRKVQPQPRGGMGGANYQADELLVLPRELLLWEEDNLREDPALLLQRYKESPQELRKLNDKLSQRALPVGVAVSEASSPNPNDPHAFMRSGEGTPRMVVIGCQDFASDAMIGQRGDAGELAHALFASSLAWLREKPAAIGIPPRTRKDYQMDPDTKVGRMLWMWGLVACVCVVGLGLGMWVVRRK